MIEVLDPGPFATVQDLGRSGYASLGVPRSGAFDRSALRLANRLVGNSDNTAAVEFTLGGLALRFGRAATVAVTGAHVPGLDWGVAVSLPAGGVLRFGTPRQGLRSYLAVRGGVDVPAELGARCTDTLSGIGPPPLQTGDSLGIGTAVDGPVLGTSATTPPTPRALTVVAGPRADWFTADALDVLTGAAWTVGPDSDRIGLRLDGPMLARSRATELPSEPTLPGAIQVPPDGRPIVFGPDAPVTGGYPVIAVLRRGALDHAAQLRPGDAVRFTE